MKKVIVKKNRYVDSVSLMGVSERVTAMQGIENAEAQMATCANQDVLKMLGYELPEAISPNDLVIAITAENESSYNAALQLAEDIIDRKNTDSDRHYGDISEIDMEEDAYDLCQISLPGEYAASEAKKALEKGMDLFIFSDNVSLEEELELKLLGQKLGKLVMGPDAGVALIEGVALAAGSIIRKGPIGIVAASGSGAQEVGCIIEKCGMGVSNIIGTGGRDLYPQIGGITMLEGIRRMEEDPDTTVIVLVSKLADLGVMDRVLTVADTCKKPVVALFLGSDETLFANHRVHGTFSLEAAALKAVELAGGEVSDFGYTDDALEALAESCIAKLSPEQKYFRGLYCGGTFTEEALQYFAAHNQGVSLYSNLKNAYSTKLEDSEQSKGHAILDLGAEDFTAKAPHPVFDPGLRLKRLCQELEDPQVAVVLLDFITGPGVAYDPITAFAKECAKHPNIIFISNICGSLEDPQNVEEKQRLLEKSGVIVTKSNYQSTRLASALMNALERR
jgi:succinyl-CoA synthetase alpha subunit